MSSLQIKTVAAYQGMRNYIRAAKLEAKPDFEHLWQTYVVGPYWAEWAEGQFNEFRAREQVKHPITSLDALEREIECLESSWVESQISAAMEKIMEAFPPLLEEQRLICIYAADPENEWIQTNGAVGTCIGDNILLQINPEADGWVEVVPFVLAHEYHHANWGYNYFAVQGKTRMDLLTGLMIDGQADSFAKMLYPEVNPSWINALAPQQEIEQWQLMQEHLNGNDPGVYARFFFGSKKNQTPANTAYTIGYHIVQAYLHRHPSSNVLDMMNLEAEEILSESGYRQ